MGILGSLILRMGADSAPLKAGLDRADRMIGGFTSRIAGISGGRGILGGLFAAGGLAAGVGSSVRAAADLEGRMIELGNAADLDAAGMKAMRDEIFAMSKEIKGVPINDLIDFMTTGAKMSIPRGELVEYTKQIAMASVAIKDMPAAELADEVGKLATGFHLGAAQTQAITSAITGLADAGVSSESGILKTTQRLSGAASAMKLTVPETASLAAALLDTGTQSDLAAGSINNLLNVMVNTREHADFARIMGVSVDQFATTIRDRPMSAVLDFLGSMRGLSAGEQGQAFRDIGIGGIEAAGELTKLTGQVDKIRANVARATTEFATGAQVQKQYEANARSANSALTDFENTTLRTKVALGDALLPGMTQALDMFNQWVPSVQTVADVFGGSLVNITIMFQDLFTNILNFGTWFVDQFPTLMSDGFSAVTTMALNAVTNLGSLLSELPRMIATGDFSMVGANFKELGAGWKPTSTEMPKWIKSELATLEGMKAVREGGAIASVSAPVAAAAASTAAAQVARRPSVWDEAMSEEEARARGLWEDPFKAAKPGEYRAVAGAEFGSQEFIASLARHESGRAEDEAKKIAKEQLKRQERMVKGIEQLVAHAVQPPTVFTLGG